MNTKGDKIMKTDIQIAQEAKMLPITEIANTMGISRSYVSRIEKNALEKLREALACRE